MTLVLGIDCSGETYSAGLWSSSGIALEAAGQQPRTALRQLPEAIAYLLKTAGVAAGDLSAVGVTRGPGSFTGVRLGVTVAKTAAMVAGCPVLGWDTLEVLAHQALGSDGSGLVPRGTVAVALDARRSELYCGVFRSTGEALETLLETDVRSPDDFLSRISWPFQAAVGTGFEVYPQLLATGFEGACLASRAASAPSGLLVARLTGGASDRWIPASELETVYHRRADIQVSGS